MGKVVLAVTYDDGTVQEIPYGQREMAEWEAQPFGCSALDAPNVKPVTYFRFLAWSALRRAQEIKPVTFEKWAAGVDEVRALGEPEDRPDPTSPGQPAGD